MKSRISSSVNARRLSQVGIDAVLIASAYALAYLLRFDSGIPERYADLLLQTIGGYSCAEIAEIMNLTEGAVMTRLTRARIALRRADGSVAARKGGTR